MNAKQREWLCRHPALAVTVSSLFWLCAAFGISELARYLLAQHIIPDIIDSVVPLFVLGLAALGIAASTFVVAIALGRSGQSIYGALKGLKYILGAVVIFMVIVIGVQDGLKSLFSNDAENFMGLAIFSLALVLFQLIGWVAAGFVTRRQIRRGKWASPVVGAAAVAKPSLRELIASKPVWTMSLLTFGTALIVVVAALALQELGEKNVWLAGKWQFIMWYGLRALVLLAALYAGTVGILLARRKKSTQQALVSAFWFPITFGFPVALLSACEYGMFKHNGHAMQAAPMLWLGILSGYYGVIYFLAGQFLGWLVAAIYGWFYRRRKKKVGAVTTE
jgi:hypothetical protein